MQVHDISKKIYKAIGNTPKVDVVKLFSAGPRSRKEVLTVETTDPHIGRVYFKQSPSGYLKSDG